MNYSGYQECVVALRQKVSHAQRFSFSLCFFFFCRNISRGAAFFHGVQMSVWTNRALSSELTQVLSQGQVLCEKLKWAISSGCDCGLISIYSRSNHYQCQSSNWRSAARSRIRHVLTCLKLFHDKVNCFYSQLFWEKLHRTALFLPPWPRKESWHGMKVTATRVLEQI